MLKFFEHQPGSYFIRCNTCGGESCGYTRPITGVDDWLDLCLFCQFEKREANNVEGFIIRKAKIDA